MHSSHSCMKSQILTLFLRLLTIVVFVELSTHDVIAGQRVALVVGCSKYANLPSNMQLISPAADSADVADALKAMGYTIVGGGAVKDPTREEFTTAAERFASAARGAEAAVFYYSGHGVQGPQGTDTFRSSRDLWVKCAEMVFLPLCYPSKDNLAAEKEFLFKLGCIHHGRYDKGCIGSLLYEVANPCSVSTAFDHRCIRGTVHA